MKKLTLTLLAICPLVAFAQKNKTEPKTNYTVSGDIKNLKSGNTVYLVYQDGESTHLDSTKVENGYFSFKGNVQSPIPAALFLNVNPVKNKPEDTADALSFYVEPANIKVQAIDSLKKSSVSGSRTNEEDIKLKNSLAPRFVEIAAVQDEFANLSETDKQDGAKAQALKSKYDKAMANISSEMETFITENNNSYISLLLCAQMLNEESALPKVKTLFSGLSDEVKQMDLAVKLTKYIEQLENAPKSATNLVGEMAKDFTQNDVNNKPVKLSDFKGKYVLLDFWASWCAPCRQENPNIVNAYHKYKDKGFTVLGVSLDKEDGKENWLQAIKTDKLEWTQVSDLKFWNNEAARIYGINSIPASFLIDPTGKIIATGLRGLDLHNKLEELLGK